MNNSKILTVSILLSIIFIGCGDKIVRMNEHTSIDYSYHPHTSDSLESETEEALLKDKRTIKRIDRYSKEIEVKINETIENINSNKDNNNLMESNKKNYDSQARGGLFPDRFDSLRLE